MSDLAIVTTPSPNWDKRDRQIDMIVLHYTGMVSGAAALSRLCSAQAQVSSHYLVMETGVIHRLVDDEHRAWHAGVSSWHGDRQTNARSIGIEIVNPGHEWGYRAFPDGQMDAVTTLVDTLVKRYRVSPALVIGHSDVAPARKEDPGELFDWARLATDGLTLAPFTGAADPYLDYHGALEALQEIGYEVPPGAPTGAVLAFQRHFCPQDLGHALSPLTRTAIGYVVEQVRSLKAP